MARESNVLARVKREGKRPWTAVIGAEGDDRCVRREERKARVAVDKSHKAEEKRERREGRDERTETKRSKHGEEARWVAGCLG